MNILAFTPETIASLVIAISFAAGLNVYATVCTLGILARLNWVELPGSLGALANPWIIAASAVLFLIEIFADKVPAFDLVWNALHTFIRIPIAVLMAYAAASQLTPAQQMLVTIIGGFIATLAHSSKTAARILVTPSPEPVSNIALSSAEDVTAIGLTWFATRHPVVAGVTAAAVTVPLIAALAWSFTRVRTALRRRFGQGRVAG